MTAGERAYRLLKARQDFEEAGRDFVRALNAVHVELLKAEEPVAADLVRGMCSDYENPDGVRMAVWRLLDRREREAHEAG